MSDFKNYLKSKYGSEGAEKESDFSVYTFEKKKKKKKKKKKQEKKKQKKLFRPNIEVETTHASAWNRPKQNEEVKLVQPKLIEQKKSNVKSFIPKVQDGSGWKIVRTEEPTTARDDASDSDQDVPMRRRHDSDDSDQEVSQMRHDSDSDQEMPTRQMRHDSDSDQEMPTRQARHDSDSDQEIPTRTRHDSDDSDQEVPRKRVRHDSDSEPEATELAPPLEEPESEDSDQEIPRRGGDDDSDSDQEIPRPGMKRRMGSEGAPDAKRRADAKKIIHRDKSGKIIQMSERDLKKKEWEDRHNMEWGAGIKQKFDREDAILDHAKSKTENLARYEDDFEMNKMLEEQDRWGDPLAAFGEKKTKKEKKKKKNKLKERPQFKGKAPFNRFGILSGYRWDGIDRSNGWEVVLAKKMAESGRNVTRDYVSERSNW